MSARTVIEHALRAYYVDSAEPAGIARDLLAQYDAERDAERRPEPEVEKDTRDGSSQSGESTHPAPRPRDLSVESFARARNRAGIAGYFRCARWGRDAAAEARGAA